MSDQRPALVAARRSRARRRAALTVPGTLLVLLVGVGILVAAEATGALVLGAALCALGVLLAARVVVGLRDAVPVPRAGTLDGGPATVVPRAGATFGIGVVAIGVLAVAVACWGVLAVADGTSVVLGVLLLLLAAVLASAVVAAAAGRFTAGGLWLTPDGLVHRTRGLESRVRWDDVALAAADERAGVLAVVARAGSGVDHAYRALWWHGVATPPGDRMLVDVRGAMPLATDLARFVGDVLAQPSSASTTPGAPGAPGAPTGRGVLAELGTPAAGERLARLAGRPVTSDTTIQPEGATVPAPGPRSSPRRGTASALVLAGAVVVVAIGAGITATAGGDVGRALIGLAVVAIGAAGAAEVLARRPVVRVRDGSTTLARSSAALVARCVQATALALVLVVLAVGFGGRSAAVLTVVALLLACWLVSLPVFVLLGLVRPGGLRIGPDGVEHRDRGRHAAVDWAGVQSVRFTPEGTVRIDVTGPGERTTAPWWHGRRSPAGAVVVDTRGLALTAPEVWTAIGTYRDAPALRAELGTTGALEARARAGA